MVDFQQLAEQCSCPVRLKQNQFYSGGLYYHRRVYADRQRIEINSIGNKAEDIVSLIHEKIHLDHETNNCGCIELTNRTLSEYHAYKEGLQIALKLGNKDVIKETILLIESQANLPDSNCHTIAAKKTVKLKIWQKCKDYLAK